MARPQLAPPLAMPAWHVCPWPEILPHLPDLLEARTTQPSPGSMWRERSGQHSPIFLFGWIGGIPGKKERRNEGYTASLGAGRHGKGSWLFGARCLCWVFSGTADTPHCPHVAELLGCSCGEAVWRSGKTLAPGTARASLQKH